MRAAFRPHRALAHESNHFRSIRKPLQPLDVLRFAQMEPGTLQVRSAFQEFRAAAIAMTPLIVAVMPIGLVFGAVAAAKGLTPAEVTLPPGSGFISASSADAPAQ